MRGDTYTYIYYDIDQDKMREGKGCSNFHPLTGGFIRDWAEV